MKEKEGEDKDTPNDVMILINEKIGKISVVINASTVLTLENVTKLWIEHIKDETSGWSR